MPDNPRPGARPTLLLTRPHAQSARFAAELAARWPGLAIVIAPLMEIVATGAAPPFAPGDAVIFTSANAIPFAGPGAGRTAWCVGAGTAARAAAAGFDARSADGAAEDLVALLRTARPEGRLWHLHGAHVRGDVVARLRAAGLAAEGHEVYAQRDLPPDAGFAAALDAAALLVPLFSPRSAALFAAAAGAPRPGAGAVALSPAVRAALPPDWQAVCDVAARPDAAALLDGLTRRISP